MCRVARDACGYTRIYFQVRMALCNFTKNYFYFRFVAVVNKNMPPKGNGGPLPFKRHLAPARGVPLLAYKTGERTTIAKRLGATFLGG